MKQQISNYFSRYAHFEQREIDQLFAAMKLQHYPKKAYLLEEGRICRYRFFVVKGLLRTFYITKKGEEKISQFAIENWWTSDLESFVEERPAQSYIQALEETTVLQLHKERLEQLFIDIPALERAFRRMTENRLIAMQRRAEHFLKSSSKERYERFVSLFPGFAQRIPQYMLASYLEITPQYLSAIRAQ